MFNARSALFLAAVCVAGFAAPAVAADPVTTSREYKVMLNPSAFSGNAATAVANFWNALKALIENASIHRPTTGNLNTVSTRTVRFYDTPGTCVLDRSDYSFRERVQNGNREVTLKFRSPDRFIADKRDVEGDDNAAVTKFEEDISAPFRSVYSHSSTVPIGAGKNLNYMDDPIGLFPGLGPLGFNESEPIAIVGGLSVYEKAYEGASVDLGALLAQFSLTLWYASSSATTPLLAEISFKYGHPTADYSNNVVTRAKALFEAMQAMTPWVAPNALLKTSFVYQYDPNFCQP